MHKGFGNSMPRRYAGQAPADSFFRLACRWAEVLSNHLRRPRVQAIRATLSGLCPDYGQTGSQLL